MSSQRKFQNGDYAFLNAKASGHLIQQLGIGAKVKIVDKGYDSEYHIETLNGQRINYVRSNALDKAPAMTSKELLEADIEAQRKIVSDANEKIATIKTKLKFLEETGQTEFNENEFKAFQVLTIIEEGGLSKLEQAQAIAMIVN